jgi:hypothetical protein
MAKTSMSQRTTMGRVIDEYAHGELKSGPRGKRESSRAMGGKNARTTTRRSPRRQTARRASR